MLVLVLVLALLLVLLLVLVVLVVLVLVLLLLLLLRMPNYVVNVFDIIYQTRFGLATTASLELYALF